MNITDNIDTKRELDQISADCVPPSLQKHKMIWVQPHHSSLGDVNGNKNTGVTYDFKFCVPVFAHTTNQVSSAAIFLTCIQKYLV
jgi:hypothetical protein